jgi:N6-adenosine-specific RNA methylase IME4
VLGVDESTVRADLGKRTAGKTAPDLPKAAKAKASKMAAAGKTAPAPNAEMSGAAAAKLAKKRSVTTQDKKERRSAREAELATKIVALPKKKYGVILADPEWRFEPWSRETGMDRAADNHYPTSPTDVIAARDVASMAADDCVLFLWATVPMLPHALLVMAAWGFAYRSNFAWVKDRIGTGYWNRNRHELLLVGVKGNVPAPAMGDQWESVLTAPVVEHSAKPDRFLEMVEAYFPRLPKIELNRRGEARPGWDAWGDEAGFRAA